MSFVGNAIGSILGGITGSTAAAKGAQQAANTQAASADKAIAEQRAAREASTAVEKPYVDAGNASLAQQMALIGLNGTDSQQTAINGLLTSPEYTTSVRQGEESILQNAAATGGLRGGNTNNSLANFRADLLSSVFNNQFNRLGSLTSIGQNAAAGVGNAGVSVANNISSLLQQQGEALAGGQIAAGNSQLNGFNAALRLGGTLAGTGLFGRTAANAIAKVGGAF